jgi:hypothetical protein
MSRVSQSGRLNGDQRRLGTILTRNCVCKVRISDAMLRKITPNTASTARDNSVYKLLFKTAYAISGTTGLSHKPIDTAYGFVKSLSGLLTRSRSGWY